MKAFLTFAACLALMGCAATFHDTVNVSGTPIKISLREDPPGSPIVTGFEVSINNMVVGTAKRKSMAPSMTHLFEPIQTPYGELRLERKFDLNLGNAHYYFEVYLNGKFAGTVTGGP